MKKSLISEIQRVQLCTILSFLLIALIFGIIISCFFSLLTELFTSFILLVLSAGYFSFIISRVMNRNIKKNINQLFFLDQTIPPIFDYEEFEKVADINSQNFLKLNLAQEALRHSTRQISNILDSITDAFYAINNNWRFIYFNEEAERLWQIKKDTVINKVIWDVFPEFLESTYYNQLYQAFIKKEPFHFEILLPNFEYWFEVHVHPFPDGLAFHFHDITKRKITEIELIQVKEELNAERERLLVTLSSIGDGVIATNQIGDVVMINKIGEELTGYTNEESFGKSLDKIFYVIDDKTSESFEIYKTVQEIGNIFYLNNAVLVNKNLIELNISLSCAPIKNPQNVHLGVIVVFQNITEKIKYESELLKTEKLESLGILAGGIAHDFNNILAAILANIQLALLKLKSGKDIKKYLFDTVETTKKASDLTKQLLTFSKGGSPVRKTTSIAEILKDTVSFALSGSKVKCLFYLSDDLWNAEIDEGQISQVINNLIINAKQAMPKGGYIEVSARNVKIDTDSRYKAGNFIKLALKDYGIGIPREHLTKIFDPFFTTKKEGSGLGLATSYSIIKKHDGYIEVESKEGVGTTFIIYLPATSNPIPGSRPNPETIYYGEGKILLMDDEDNIRKVVGDMLRYCGYEVVLAKDGEEAIDLYTLAKKNGAPFDAAIMDLTIPGGMGGQEAIAHLLDIDPHIKAIVSSGYANNPIIADYRRFGFCGVVTKPYKLDELNDLLNQIISKKQLKLF